MSASDGLDRLLPWLSQMVKRLGGGAGGVAATAPAADEAPTADLLLRELLTIVKGFRNGLVYGAKIRLPHALVMTFLFRNEP